MPNGQKAKLDLVTLEAHFHLPMQEVAKPCTYAAALASAAWIGLAM
jgi:hypothetical protein